tara:strand:- start:3879 stop:4658 length:780 start_codon:yes stop_codon:yes gene_type:complete
MEDIMGFKTNGSSHKNGIKNEVRVAKKLEKLGQKLFPNLSDDFEVILKGGTQNKADAVIKDANETEIPISIKNKKSLKKGSYDHINSSRAFTECPSLQGVKQRIKQIDTDRSIDAVRENVTTVLNEAMRGLSSEEISSILNDHVNAKNKGMVVVISDRENKTDYKFNFDDMPLKHSIEHHTPKLQWGRGKTSAKVVFEDSKGNTVDHNLRIRAVLNNGVGALMGDSEANTTSSPVIKIQQDRVDKVIDGLKAINKVQTF